MKQMSSQILKGFFFLNVDSQIMVVAYLQVRPITSVYGNYHNKKLSFKERQQDTQKWSILFTTYYSHEDYFFAFPNNVNIMVSVKCYFNARVALLTYISNFEAIIL